MIRGQPGLHWQRIVGDVGGTVMPSTVVWSFVSMPRMMRALDQTLKRSLKGES
jgi:hypothetical protein